MCTYVYVCDRLSLGVDKRTKEKRLLQKLKRQTLAKFKCRRENPSPTLFTNYKTLANDVSGRRYYVRQSALAGGRSCRPNSPPFQALPSSSGSPLPHRHLPRGRPSYVVPMARAERLHQPYVGLWRISGSRLCHSEHGVSAGRLCHGASEALCARGRRPTVCRYRHTGECKYGIWSSSLWRDFAAFVFICIKIIT